MSVSNLSVCQDCYTLGDLGPCPKHTNKGEGSWLPGLIHAKDCRCERCQEAGVNGYRVAAPVPQSGGEAQRDEVAWLIERGQLCLGFCEHKFTWLTFTDENALRFSRSRDAYSFMETAKWKPFNLPLEGSIVTEHLWAALTSDRGAGTGEEFIEDGFGSRWSKRCPDCDELTMAVVRPGKVQCENPNGCKPHCYCCDALGDCVKEASRALNINPEGETYGEAVKRIEDAAFERGKLAAIKGVAFPNAEQPKQYCCGYPDCDADLPGEAHSPECPLYDEKEWNLQEQREQEIALQIYLDEVQAYQWLL